MKIIDGATLQVSANELITVIVRKTVAPYQASIAPLIGAAWSASPDPPLGLTGQGAFMSPATGRSVTMTIQGDFVPNPDGSNPPGDRYDIVIAGLPTEDTRVVNLFPPGLQSRSFLFQVV